LARLPLPELLLELYVCLIFKLLWRCRRPARNITILFSRIYRLLMSENHRHMDSRALHHNHTCFMMPLNFFLTRNIPRSSSIIYSLLKYIFRLTHQIECCQDAMLSHAACQDSNMNSTLYRLMEIERKGCIYASTHSLTHSLTHCKL
jgi:hypothetical protein